MTDETRQPLEVLPGTRLKVDPALNLNSPKRARIIEARRERVAYYMMLNWTELQIAQALEVSPSLVHYDIEAVRQLWRERTVEHVAESAIQDLARLDHLIAVLIPNGEDFKTADTICRLITARAMILGYSKGMTFDVSAYIRKLAEQNGYDPEIAIQVAARISVNFRE